MWLEDMRLCTFSLRVRWSVNDDTHADLRHSVVCCVIAGTAHNGVISTVQSAPIRAPTIIRRVEEHAFWVAPCVGYHRVRHATIARKLSHRRCLVSKSSRQYLRSMCNTCHVGVDRIFTLLQVMHCFCPGMFCTPQSTICNHGPILHLLVCDVYCTVGLQTTCSGEDGTAKYSYHARCPSFVISNCVLIVHEGWSPIFNVVRVF